MYRVLVVLFKFYRLIIDSLDNPNIKKETLTHINLSNINILLYLKFLTAVPK